ncbi:hypothetical protein LUZ63_013136 [Rhynchospora breviuscula]|uniref:Structural maintenance of chromosomes protein n=1 Tax=Rhynchospora breviuscula TaxID=2022672 RepID=A0A9Q0C7Z0_9POAL|nr:hypothetical protein LUZ63_013136 [Rhynchospora breviuscula]
MGEEAMEIDGSGENRGASSPFSPASARKRKPRLFIKEMVLRNFKSYAGEQRIGPFHKSFSAVVGPNGSGKSNVIDAMLFVFGKRAKQMRLNKVSELIHNSTNHQNLDSASVSVHFQEIVDLEDGSYEVVPGSEFSITRVAFKDNSSKYYINNRGSNFTGVTKKLKGKGVDLDNNRFLILQGEVEQISLMKPKAQGPHDEGFLEYLEDIIGTNQYVEKIDDAFKQLEVLNEKRTAAVQMVKLAEKERDSLESVKDEAEAYMLKELLSLKWQEKATELASDDAAKQVAQLQEDVANMEATRNSEREKIKQHSNELNKLESLYDNYLKRQESLEKEMSKCKEDCKVYEKKEVEYVEKEKHLKQKIKKLEDKIEKDTIKINDSTKDIEESSDAIPKLEEEIPKLDDLLVKEEELLEELKKSTLDETEKLCDELAKVRMELEPWEKQLIEHKGKRDVAISKKKLLEEKHHKARTEYISLKEDMEGINKRISLLKNEILEKKSIIARLEAEKKAFQDKEKECLKEEELLIPREQEARQKFTEMKTAQESEKSQSSVLKAIIQAKDTKQIEGIYGRLGDLGAINAKYDVAISTACKGLDNILVETTDAAQACIALLREKNLGIATFMILDKQKEQMHRMKEKVQTPEGVPRLFDLVTVKDERFKLAFFAALKNTVVANDLDQASTVAYKSNKKWRVVTLDGALFEEAGTMTGGGAKPRGGKMGTSIKASISPEAVASAEQELEMLNNKLRGLRLSIDEARRGIQAAEAGISRAEMELGKWEREVQSLTEQYIYDEKRLDSLKVASEPKEDELNQLEELKDVISTETAEVQKIINCSSKLKDKASELQQGIENAGGERLKNQKSKVAGIQSEIDKTKTEINRHKVKITTSEKLVTKLKKAVEDSKKERDKLAENKEKESSKFKDVQEKAFTVQENYQNTQKMMDEHKVVLDETKEQYNTKKKTMDELRAAEVDAEFKLQDLKKQKKEYEMKAKAFSKGLEDIRGNLDKHMTQIKKDAVDPEKLDATLSDESLKEDCDLKRATEMVALLQSQLKEMNPNLDSIAEYRKKTDLYNERVKELNAATIERDELKKLYDGLKKKRLDEFMVGFNVISLKLKEMYQMITLGGDAELELVDSLDPFSEGVVFSVRPPKKSWKNIANLSGGEKTLSSLALVFALHHYKPTPLYVMDEIDAALDFKNVSIVGHYVKDRTRDAQFIIISLRNNMFELADRLVGIYKTDNCTKSITINPGCFADGSKVAS